jgi:hypothetical protein
VHHFVRLVQAVLLRRISQHRFVLLQHFGGDVLLGEFGEQSDLCF